MFTDSMDVLIFFIVTTPLFGWIMSKFGYRKLQGFYATFGLLISAYFLYGLYEKVSRGPIVIGVPPLGALLEIDMLSVFMASVVVMLSVFAFIYSFRYMEPDADLTRYYTLLLGIVTGMMGVVFAGDFFTLYIFWELMCLTSYTLVAFRKERWEALEAGFKYLLMSSAGAVTLLLAMSFLYGMTGTLNFASITVSLSKTSSNSWLLLTLILIVMGFGINAAIVPFHTWLPDAHPAAPSPVSAILSGIVIEVSVYALSRVLFLFFPLPQFDWRTLIAILSVVTMTVGNLTALLQNDVKRLLAYSSIAQIGYILVGIAAGTQLGLTGAMFHIFNHALMKGLAFLCVGAFIYRAKTRNLDELSGIGRKMPMSIATLSIALLALAGMPPLSGFMSKFLLFTAAIPAGMAWLAIAGVLNSAFSLAYYARLILVLIQPQIAKKAEAAKEASITMLAPMCIMSAFIILFGVWPKPIIDFAQRAAECLIDAEAYISVAV